LADAADRSARSRLEPLAEGRIRPTVVAHLATTSVMGNSPPNRTGKNMRVVTAAVYVAAGLITSVVSAFAQSPCERQTASLEKLASDVDISLIVPDRLVSGDRLEVRWKVAQRFPLKTPVYVVVAVSDDIRLEHTYPIPGSDAKISGREIAEAMDRPPGVIVLPGRTRAPHGLRAGDDKSRILVPLYQPGSQLEGRVAVRIFRAGRANISARILAVSSCGERVLSKPIDRAIEVSPSAPVIVVQDPYEIEKPKQVIISNSGRYRVHVFDASYRVFDVVTGAKLLDRAGHNPNLSPTERFVVANVGSGTGKDFEVVDLVSQEVVARPSGPAIAWTHGDAFMVDGADRNGGLTIHPMLISRAVVSGEGHTPKLTHPVGCQQCTSWENASFNLDLDNGVVSFGDGAMGGEDDLAELATGYMTRFDTEFEKSYGVAPHERKDGWLAAEPIHFSHFDTGYADTSARSDELKSRVYRHREHQSLPAGAGFPGQAPASSSLGDWRQRVVLPRVALSTNTDARNDLVKALKQFSLEFATPNLVERIPFSNLREALPFRGSNGISNVVKVPADQASVFMDRTKHLLATLTRDYPNLKPVFDKSGSAGPNGFRRDVSDIALPGIGGGEIPNLIDSGWRWEVAGEPIWLIQMLSEVGVSGSAFIAKTVLFKRQGGNSHWFDLDEYTKAFSVPNHVTPADIFAYTGKLKARLFADRYLIMASAHWSTMGVIDLQGERPTSVDIRIPHGDLLDDVLLTPDARHVVQVNRDGQFFLHEIATRRLVVSGRFVDDEIILYTAEGYYWSSYEGAHFIQLRFPGLPGVASFRQFARLLDRPEFVRARLDGRDTAGVQPPKLSPPPTLALALEGDGAQPKVRATMQAHAGTTLSRLRLYLDGHQIEDVTLTGTSETRRLPLPPAGNARWLTALATDANSVVSAPASLHLKRGRASASRLFAVVVGVDAYSDPELALNFAVSDARRLAGALASNRGNYYTSRRINLRLNSDATAANILGDLTRMVANATAADTIVLSIASHGLQSATGHFFVTPHGFRLDNLESTGLAWSKITAILQQSKARVVVILDTCKSGATGANGLATNDEAAAALLAGTRAPMLVLAATKGRQQALEGPRWGGGVFTYALVQALQHDRARFDLNRDGSIEVSELFKGVRAIVASETGDEQTPWLVRQDLIGDFSLF
jgi:hypothetical protein